MGAGEVVAGAAIGAAVLYFVAKAVVGQDAAAAVAPATPGAKQPSVDPNAAPRDPGHHAPEYNYGTPALQTPSGNALVYATPAGIGWKQDINPDEGPNAAGATAGAIGSAASFGIFRPRFNRSRAGQGGFIPDESNVGTPWGDLFTSNKQERFMEYGTDANGVPTQTGGIRNVKKPGLLAWLGL